MTCAEFQKALPYIFDSGGNAEQEEHLRNCSVCSDLVNDLKYIADQAKLLVPMMDPPKKVWDGIKTSLQQEGLVKNSARGRLLGSTARTRWGPATWLIPLAAVLLLAVGLVSYRNNMDQQPASAQARPEGGAAMASSVPAAPMEFASMNNAQDQQILSEVAEHAPALSQAYRQDLQRVNTYIADASGLVASNPDDEEGRQALMAAYQQKAMLYKMATQHTLP
jgi:hypothetical protein